MICKEDVVLWFKELESYKRIDTMCTLLNMCLPFELRFLGTCLEELGRRDSQELRGIELRVNNPAELASDVASCRTGEPTDRKIRRKMALYLALIRACNRPCVNELFQTLDGWGDRDFLKLADGDPFQELLLVYTMAANHPVFSFEQRMKCGEIYNKINDCNMKYENQMQSSNTTTPEPISAAVTSTINNSHSSLQQQQQQPQSNHSSLQMHNTQQQPQQIQLQQNSHSNNNIQSPPPLSSSQQQPPQQQIMSLPHMSGLMMPQSGLTVGYTPNAVSQVFISIFYYLS